MALTKVYDSNLHGADVEVYEESALNPASIAAATTAETAVTVTGAKTTDRVIALPIDTLDSGLAPGGARVSAADTVQIRIVNATAAAIDGAAKKWLIILFRG